MLSKRYANYFCHNIIKNVQTKYNNGSYKNGTEPVNCEKTKTMLNKMKKNILNIMNIS